MTTAAWPRRAERWARWFVVGATVWYVLATSWGLFGPVGGGHAAVVAARAIIAENMLAWRIWGPVREYTTGPPTPQLYYVHHPWGMFWTIAALMDVLGRHSYVPRLAAIALSAACPPMLYGIGRALWGPVPGALAALAYVVLPITLAFGNFPGFEVPVVFGCLLTTWGYVRFAHRWRLRWMAVALLGVLWSAHADWEAYVFLAFILGAQLAMVYLLPPQVFGRIDVRRFGQWWALAVTISVVTAVGYVVYFVQIGSIKSLLDGEAMRSHGNAMPIAEVLKARSYWIELAFTPLAILVGKVALPVFFWRVLVLRRPLEIFPLGMLAAAVQEYVTFKQGADVHFYWPLPFAPYWALSVGVLSAVGMNLARRILERRGAYRGVALVPAVTLGAFALIPVAILADGISGLSYGRATAGRFNDRGRRIFQDIDKTQALLWMAKRMAGDERVEIHSSMHSTWATDWALNRPLVGVEHLPTVLRGPGERYFICDLRFVSTGDLQVLAETFHLVVVGPFALIDRTEPASPVDGYALEAREPTLLEWYFVTGPDPVRSIRPDPYYTWELRDHLGQGPNTAPLADPVTRDELRVAHDIAVVEQDADRATRYFRALEAQLDTEPATTFSDGTRVLGVRYTPGVAPVLEVYFLAAGPTPTEDQFEIESLVWQKAPWSLVRADDKVRVVGVPFVVPTTLWKSGYIYVERAEIRHRPGREAFAGYFISPKGSPPKPRDGPARLPLLSLP
ncbi:MAG TPA: glycosyltransferase family 39 protein [Polyangiaceae bacterium]|nr:glycosyltransferase family 39 protein [Polyangiaceae bacterium]